MESDEIPFSFKLMIWNLYESNLYASNSEQKEYADKILVECGLEIDSEKLFRIVDRRKWMLGKIKYGL